MFGKLDGLAVFCGKRCEHLPQTRVDAIVQIGMIAPSVQVEQGDGFVLATEIVGYGVSRDLINPRRNFFRVVWQQKNTPPTIRGAKPSDLGRLIGDG